MSTTEVVIILKRRGNRCERESEALPGIPRITRLMALAIKFQDMVESGQVRDYADLARLGYVTRARLTQIMNLLLLAPDIQETLLQPGSTGSSRCFLAERQLRQVISAADWPTQRRLFAKLQKELGMALRHSGSHPNEYDTLRGQLAANPLEPK